MYEYSNISTHIIILSHNVCACINTRIIISILEYKYKYICKYSYFK